MSSLPRGRCECGTLIIDGKCSTCSPLSQPHHAARSLESKLARREREGVRIGVGIIAARAGFEKNVMPALTVGARRQLEIYAAHTRRGARAARGARR